MRLKAHLSCTGATFDEGSAASTDKAGSTKSRVQLGGFFDGPATNTATPTAEPDVVTLSLGANDIDFEAVVEGLLPAIVGDL